MERFTKIVRTLALKIGMLLLLLVPIQSGWTAPIEIEIWGNGRHMDALKPIVEKYNQSQSEIYVSIPGKNESPDTILGAHLAGELPAIIESARIYTTQYSAAGLMADMTPFIEREPGNFLDDFIPATLYTDNMIDGRIYSLPSFLQINNLYYNPEVLSSVAVPAPQEGWSWSDLRDSARRARTVDSAGDRESWGLVGESPFALDWTLLGQMGGRLVTDDYRVTVDSSEVRETYNFLFDMMDRGLLDYTFTNPQAADADIRSHKTAFYASASYRQDFWTNNESPMTVTPPIRWGDRNAVTRFTDRSWAIMNVSDEEKQAAWKVIKFLLQPENQAQWLVSLGYPPATFSAAQHPLFVDYMQDHPNMQIFADQYFTLSNAIVYPIPLNQVDVYGDAVAAAQQLIRGQVSISEYIANQTAYFEAKVAEYLKE